MEKDIAISVKNVSKYYKMFGSATDRFKEFLLPGKKSLHKKFWALQDISFEIEKGTTFGIVGQNGSGKSTLLQIISGIIRPSSGSVTVNGRISALLELGAGFHTDFSGRENVFMQGALMGISRKEMERNYENILEFADIGAFIDQPVKTYSSGMYVRLAFATAVNIDPDVLIVDEVLAVGDDMFRRRCFSKIEEFQENGKTILFVSHSLPTVSSICKGAMLLDRGNILKIGETRHVVNEYSRIVAEREAEYISRQKKINNYRIESRGNKKESNSGTGYYSNRFGTGDAVIEEFNVVNENGEYTDVLKTGERYIFRVKVKFNKKTDRPDIGMNIITLTGLQIYGICPMVAKDPMESVDANTLVTAEFNLLNILNPGEYSININIAEFFKEERVFLERHLDIKTFKVVGDTGSYGLVNMDADIKIEKPNP